MVILLVFFFFHVLLPLDACAHFAHTVAPDTFTLHIQLVNREQCEKEEINGQPDTDNEHVIIFSEFMFHWQQFVCLHMAASHRSAEMCIRLLQSNCSAIVFCVYCSCICLLYVCVLRREYRTIFNWTAERQRAAAKFPDNLTEYHPTVRYSSKGNSNVGENCDVTLQAAVANPIVFIGPLTRGSAMNEQMFMGMQRQIWLYSWMRTRVQQFPNAPVDSTCWLMQWAHA